MLAGVNAICYRSCTVHSHQFAVKACWIQVGLWFFCLFLPVFQANLDILKNISGGDPVNRLRMMMVRPIYPEAVSAASTPASDAPASSR